MAVLVVGCCLFGWLVLFLPVFWFFVESVLGFPYWLDACFWVFGFCLESLILAQDERWRRA